MAVSSAPVLAFLGITLNPLTLAKDIANAIFSAALALFGQGAASVVGALLGFVKTTSDPVFSGGWWSSSGMAVFERVLAVSGSLLALAFMCSIITALLSADHGLLARAALRLPIAVLEMALLVGVTAALVSASDEISAEIAKGASGTLSTFVSGELAGAIAGTGIVGLIAGALVILAALGIWAELLCRSALIYLAVLAGPLIFAASVHPSAVGLRRRYVEGGLALICSKIVVALALATGSAMLSGLGHSSSFAAATGALLEALAVLLVACFAPFVLLRLSARRRGDHRRRRPRAPTGPGGALDDRRRFVGRRVLVDGSRAHRRRRDTARRREPGFSRLWRGAVGAVVHVTAARPHLATSRSVSSLGVRGRGSSSTELTRRGPAAARELA